MPHILTANRLSDGAVVYRMADGGWTESLDEAALVEAAHREAAELDGRAAERALLVVGAYLMDAVREGAQLKPVKMREIIRAAGPSVRLDLGKQADPASAPEGKS